MAIFANHRRDSHKIKHMICKGCAAHLALVFLFCVSATCVSQTVTIRIVDLTNGRPEGNIAVYVSGLNGNALDKDERRKLHSKPISADLRMTTDTNGEAGFSLPTSVSDHFYVRAVLNGSHWDCSCTVRVPTNKVLQEGFTVTSPYADRKHEQPARPKPGELIFGLRPLPLWVRALWPILKG